MAHTDGSLGCGWVPIADSLQHLLGTYAGAERQLPRIRVCCSWVQVQMQEIEKRLAREAAEVDFMCKQLECHV